MPRILTPSRFRLAEMSLVGSPPPFFYEHEVSAQAGCDRVQVRLWAATTSAVTVAGLRAAYLITAGSSTMILM